MYRNDITVEQRQYLLQAIEFVRLAAERARKRKALREEFEGAAVVWGYADAA